MRTALNVWAFVLILVAAWFIYAGFSMDVTVANTSTDVLGGSQNVANLELMHIQLLDVIIGVVSALGACVMFAAAAIVAAIENGATRTARSGTESH